MSRLSDLSKVGVIDTASIMGDSEFFKNRFNVITPLPILNIAFSGEVKKGFGCGLTMLAGESGSYKTMLALYCMKAYLDTYEDACGIIYDSEFSIDEEYLSSFGIDSDRILHIPIENIEELKQDCYAKLKEIKHGEHFFILIDSIGNLVSKKTIDDIENEKTAVDMTRAKQLKPLFSLMTNGSNIKDIPIFVINHSYETQEMFSKTVVSGGRAAMYVPNVVFNMSRKADRATDKSLLGFEFTIGVMKSRIIRAFSRLSFDVNFETGINPYSGILELAVEYGIIKSSGGWYQLLDDIDNKNPVGAKMREIQCNTEEILGKILKNPNFNEFVKSKYKLNSK